ncbi:MAG TPA: 3-hydroxybutyrate oligomer hydrolase family protein, partial [Beijerinckiaceae bacterium]|nr:3-hydroxybutyrate oligomer hydrolase family protein [Beijerinckiaceae bacterium]
MKKGIWLAAAFLASASLGAFTAARAAGLDGDVVHTHYDGATNDLLTGGLGKTGLGSPVPPVLVDPLHPTAEELRRLAIYNNYRALIDPTPGGGYGTLYGPNV